MIASLVPAAAAFATPPTPRIVAYATHGQAPFAVHVQGLTSTLNAGDESMARYEWTFGDNGGQYNALVGWNAAHIYDNPGVYTLTLRVTNANREAASTSVQITVDPPARTAVYVSPQGSSTGSGTSSASPVNLARAGQLMGDNKAFYLQRGAVFSGGDGFYVGSSNVLISAYGSGALPKIYYTDPTQFTRIIQVGSSARNLVIENLALDSPFTPDNTIVRGISINGTNVTVRNCQFGNVSYATTTAGGAFGVLTLNNQCGTLGAYYCWVEGADQTHLGNVVGDSVDEHIMRFGGASRVLIANNDFTNTGKSSIWCMLGDHAYIAGNRLHLGRMIAGPNFAVTYPSDHFDWVVAENNEYFGAGVVMYDGASGIVLRNNVFHADGFEAVSIWGYSPDRGRTVSNVNILNNTFMNNDSQYGRCIHVGAGDQSVTVVNNLYVAPHLNGNNGTNVMCDDTSLSNHVFRNNIWANPAVGPRWDVVNGSPLNASQWDALPQTTGELARTFGTADLGSSLQPLFAAGVGAPVAGVFTDFHGNSRPASGAWTAGAVESGSSSPPPPGGGDVNHDGHIDVNDLLSVVGGWGSCHSCPGDTNGDGLVNVNDLLAVISGWN